jgi:malyl-CoA/(S)-citramalyl-CoA lyase
MWHYADQRAWWWPAAPTGCGPIDGPFGDFNDPDGYHFRGAPRRRAGLRRQVGHPPRRRSRWRTTVYSPSAAEVTKAKRILEAMARRQKEGKGAVSLDGRLIDIASIRQAEVLVKKAEQIGAHAG